MRLGPSLHAHIPAFIADGLKALRTSFSKTGASTDAAASDKAEALPVEMTGEEEMTLETETEESKGEETKDATQSGRKDDGRIKDKSQKRNIQFERYYRQLNVVPSTEWAELYDKLKTPLDICFRVNTVGQYKDDTKATLDSFIAAMQAEEEFKEKTP